jgi:2-dehydro-3-deoxyphosphogluconate aldolase/(4S)-4-hydroxy-2-oxoglutarate aldolase
MDTKRFLKKPLMGIVRGVSADVIEPLTECVISAGLETIEITMNTEGAPGLIKKCRNKAGGRLAVGAGTVLGMKSLKEALAAGASFIVTPVLVPDVTKYCVKNRIPVFPGALTPSEVYKAWDSGAFMVKVFPSGFFGPAYFSELKGPFDDIKLLACGGVRPENMEEYIKAGADAVSFGASVFSRARLIAGDFTAIETLVSKYVGNIG